jgi:peptide/nickel transport system substrate-binding protein
MKFLKLFTLFFLLTLIFISCSRNPKYTLKKEFTDKPAYGDVLIDSSIGEAAVLNPVLASDSASFNIIGQIFNGLVRYNKDLQLEGDLAEKWLVSVDGKTITFYLRKNVKWQDGVEFTSRDVKFTYDKYMDPSVKTAYKSKFDLVEKIETPDKYTFIVHYKKPYAPALESWGVSIIPSHILEGQDINKTIFNRSPVGTGAYCFKKWKTGQKIELFSNKNYYEGTPYITGYVSLFIPDQSVQFMNLQSGNVDMMELTTDQYIKKTSSKDFTDNFNKYQYPAFRFIYIGYNETNPLFTDKRVRQALSYALNRDEIISGVCQGLARKLTGPFIPGSWAYNNEVVGYEYNPDKALKILNDAGWKKGSDSILVKDGKRFSFTLYTNHGNKEREEIAAIAQQQWGKLGIEVKIRVIEWNVFITQYLDKKNFDAVVMGWSLALDPDCYDIWNSAKTGEGEFNFVSYKNSEVDELLEKGRTTFDTAKRASIYKKIHALIAEDAPYTFLYAPYTLMAVHKRVHGIEPAPSGISYNQIKWYVPEEIQKYRITMSEK